MQASKEFLRTNQMIIRHTCSTGGDSDTRVRSGSVVAPLRTVAAVQVVSGALVDVFASVTVLRKLVTGTALNTGRWQPPLMYA